MDCGQDVVSDEAGNPGKARPTRHISFTRPMLAAANDYGRKKGWTISRVVEEALADYLRRKAGFKP